VLRDINDIELKHKLAERVRVGLLFLKITLNAKLSLHSPEFDEDFFPLFTA
jgi:hypothetical protein